MNNKIIPLTLILLLAFSMGQSVVSNKSDDKPLDQIANDGLKDQITNNLPDFSDEDLTPDALEEGPNNEIISPAEYSSNLYPSQDVSPVQLDNVIDEYHVPGRDSYIIDFGYQLSIPISSETHVIYDGLLGFLSAKATFTVDIDVTIPVNMTLNYNSTFTAGTPTDVNATLFNAGDITFYVNFTLGISGQIGIGFFSRTYYDYGFEIGYDLLIYQGAIPYDATPYEKWQQSIPLDKLISGVIPGLGSAITSVFDFNLLLTPQYDVDIFADVVTDDPLNNDPLQLRFSTTETKSFAVNTDQLTIDSTDFHFGLTNFKMKFYASLLWSLEIKFGSILNFLNNFFGNGFTWNMFTWPRIELPGGIIDKPPSSLVSGTGTVSADTTSLPDFGIGSYTLSEQNSNGILDPNENATVGFNLNNYGDGGSINSNVSYSSPDFIINSPKQSLGTFIRTGDTKTATVDFSVPLAYVKRNGNITLTIDSLTPTGTVYTQQLIFTLRVLQPSSMFINPSLFEYYEPNDGIWDAGEEITISLQLDNYGSTIGYLEVGLDSVSGSGFTSTNSWGSTTGDVSMYNIGSITLTSPLTIQQKQLDITMYVYYENPAGDTYYLEYYVYTIEMRPLTPELSLTNVYVQTIGQDDGDGLYEAGEIFSLTSNVENLGTDDASLVVGYLTADDSNIIIEDDYFVWYNLAKGTSSLSSNTLNFAINYLIETKTVTFTYYLFTWTWYDEMVVNQYTFTLDFHAYDAPVVDVYYNVETENNAAVEMAPGEFSLVTFGLDLVSGAFQKAEGTLTTSTDGIEIINGTNTFSTYVDIYHSGYIYSNDLVVYTLPNFAGGNIDFVYNVTYTYLNGSQETKLYSFTISNVAQGDVQAPTASQTIDPVTCLTSGTTVDIIINTSDNLGISAIYFFYWNTTKATWEVLSWTDRNSLSLQLTITLTSGGETFYYGYIVFDTAGNSVTAGEDMDLYIESCPDNNTGTNTSTGTGINTNTDTNTSSGTPSSSGSPKQPSDVGGMNIIMVAMILPIFVINILRKRKR